MFVLGFYKNFRAWANLFYLFSKRNYFNIRFIDTLYLFFLLLCCYKTFSTELQKTKNNPLHNTVDCVIRTYTYIKLLNAALDSSRSSSGCNPTAEYRQQLQQKLPVALRIEKNFVVIGWHKMTLWLTRFWCVYIDWVI